MRVLSTRACGVEEGGAEVPPERVSAGVGIVELSDGTNVRYRRSFDRQTLTEFGIR